MTNEQTPQAAPTDDYFDDDGPQISLVDLLTWLGEGKRLIAAVTVAAAAVSLAVALALPAIYTARTSLLPPGAQQQSGASAALAALGSPGSLVGGSGAKTPDELYVALLTSDSVTRALDEHFGLEARYDVKNFEALRKTLPTFIRVSSDKKTGVIAIEVDDKDPKFAADLANAHLGEVTKVLSRLAVSEAQQRRVFFEQQLKDTKESLIKAETDLRSVQERSGVIVLDKQAEALIAGAAQVRALIAEREVRLKVMRTGATERNPDMIRLNSELGALRTELARMESTQGGNPGSAVDLPVGKIPAAAIDYVRARRELKLQEALLDAMVRQYEQAKLDEAKEGPLLQQIDRALPPDFKSKPARGFIVLISMLTALLVSAAWVVMHHCGLLAREQDPDRTKAWLAMKRAWQLRT